MCVVVIGQEKLRDVGCVYVYIYIYVYVYIYIYIYIDIMQGGCVML
jgi:hypothetical protein